VSQLELDRTVVTTATVTVTITAAAAVAAAAAACCYHSDFIMYFNILTGKESLRGVA
jgi:hypothetical protein